MEGWLRWFTHCSGGAVFRGHAVTCFCSLLLRSGSWIFLVSLYLLVHDLLQLHRHIVIFSPL